VIFHEEDNWGLPMKMRKIVKLPEALCPSVWKKGQIDGSLPNTARGILSEGALLRNMTSAYGSADVLSGGLLGNVWESGWRRW
jgi:hypothetical protein